MDLNELRRLAGLPLQEQSSESDAKNVTLIVAMVQEAQESLKRVTSLIDKLARETNDHNWPKDALPKELLLKVEDLIALRADLDKAEQVLKAYWRGKVEK